MKKINGKTVAALLEKVRREKPLIHHLTNFVTMGDCAAITVCTGALPVMAQAEEEVEEMVLAARAAVINTGTLSSDRARAMGLMGLKAREKCIPVVFDPVGAGATCFRTREIFALLQVIKPPIIKGNIAEIGFLAGEHGTTAGATQAINYGINPIRAARQLREKLNYEAVITVTGTVDVISAPAGTAFVLNGHSFLPLIVGSGCMAASVIAAFAAVEENQFLAATAALVALGVSAELAAGAAGWQGPAAFKSSWLDALFCLSGSTLSEYARIVVEGPC